MEKQELLERTGIYLEDYLDDFVIHGKVSDIRYSSYGVTIPAHAVRNFEDVEEVDRHRSRFSQIHEALPEAGLFDFVRALSSMKDAVLVDIGSMLMGADFSLWVAAQNRSSEVHIYNPDVDCDFPPFLFNELKRERVFKLKEKTELDTSRPEESAERLFRANGLPNIYYHCARIGKEGLESIAEADADRPVVFFSRRTPTMPEEMTSQIASVTAGHPNSHMILLPLINTRIDAYHDDRIIKLINRYRFAREHHKDPTSEPSANAATRLFTATQQYYALKAASVVGERAKVYRERERETGFPFHHPTHYVSTVEPLRGRTQE
ncbi:hypothetical protein JW898_02125 [Candidatus Woesearchaeota archaeon]|nr:hypothetical protein [Candidatus Woesearchaeota archaeon]